MSNKSLLHTLVCMSVLLFTVVISPPASASAASQKKEMSAEEVRTKVESFGVGLTARVRVKLRNGSKVKGFIDRAGDDYFYLIRTEGRYSTSVVIAYADVAQIEGVKNSIDWRKVAYRTGMGAGVALSILRSLRIQGPRIGPRFHH